MSQGPATDGDVHGHGADFHAACKDAWKNRPEGGPTEYVVTEIKVTGTNPISGYSVILRPS
jgi:hypothetical protein